MSGSGPAWARRFVAVLEAGAEHGRLARGRGHDRAGAVTGLRVRPGEVTAQVRGPAGRRYRVSLIVVELDAAQWSTAAAALASQPLFRARLLAGELPPEVELVFDRLGLPLLPRGAADVVAGCSCPDWRQPCEHVAATLYALADALGGDPFLLLTWRGREKGAFLAELLRHAGARQDDRADSADGSGDAAPPACPEPPEPSAADFWAPVPLPPPPEPVGPPVWALHETDGEPEALVAELLPLYERLTGSAADAS
ncbi:SWIM zinc finger family protein [Marinactinospora rubrisoli]|uniref:SWIM zinc finger family protein n=1 Tax=Marinactinospora rubrisoli TaxID=2715399 RepID=A0ABW2KM21_9ACTN